MKPSIVLAGLLLSLCLGTLPCVAADAPVAPEVVLADATIPYSPAETWDADLQRECDWDRTTVLHLVEEAKGRVVLPGAAGAALPRRLSLVTQTMHIVGGGTFTGPKWIVLNGKLVENDRTIGSFEARRQSFRGSLRGCTTARELGESIAEDIVEWLEQPTMNAKLGDAK